jgi:hypothetical protein
MASGGVDSGARGGEPNRRLAQTRGWARIQKRTSPPSALTAVSPGMRPLVAGSFVSETILPIEELSGSLCERPQGSSAFFWEIKRRTRSARSAPSNGFLNASLNPSAKVSSPGSSLVSASRIVPM